MCLEPSFSHGLKSRAVHLVNVMLQVGGHKALAPQGLRHVGCWRMPCFSVKSCLHASDSSSAEASMFAAFLSLLRRLLTVAADLRSFAALHEQSWLALLPWLGYRCLALVLPSGVGRLRFSCVCMRSSPSCFSEEWDCWSLACSMQLSSLHSVYTYLTHTSCSVSDSSPIPTFPFTGV